MAWLLHAHEHPGGQSALREAWVREAGLIGPRKSAAGGCQVGTAAEGAAPMAALRSSGNHNRHPQP